MRTTLLSSLIAAPLLAGSLLIAQPHAEAAGREPARVLVFVGSIRHAEQQFGDRRQPRLRITHRRGVVAVARAEVALPVDQRIADVEVLRESGHRVIDRGVAMRMVVAHHVAGNFCRFAEPARGGKP